MATFSDKNVGALDRALRFALGAGLLLLTFYTPNSNDWLEDMVDLGITLFGFSLILSALLAHCWVYQFFGWTTCATE